MNKPSPQQESAARIAAGWFHLRPDEVCVACKSLAQDMYAGLVTAGLPGPMANQLAAEFCCIVIDELMQLWTPPETGTVH